MEYSHAFVVLAYKESIYLENCVLSLLNQKEKSRVVICTSTPNAYISSIADKYGLEIFINNSQYKGTIAGDWNFALHSVPVDLVTLAHQDDIYNQNFYFELCQRKQSWNEMLIAFTDSVEIHNDVFVSNRPILTIKKILLFPFLISKNIKNVFLKKLSLVFGCPISCPSVTFNMHNLRNFAFDVNMRVSLDWEAWYRMANMNGSFLYINKGLTAHRIHQGSETTKMIGENMRWKEDKWIFEKIWGGFIGGIFAALYSLSYKSNNTSV